MRTEDHPLEYRTFEGVIPRDQYGAGAIIVWDEGEYDPVAGRTASDGVEEDRNRGTDLMRPAIDRGDVKVEFRGKKLRGRYAMIRLKDHGAEASSGNTWLMIKDRDEYAEESSGAPGHDRSVLSGRSLEQVVHPAHVSVEIEESDLALELIEASTESVILPLVAGRVRLTNLNKIYWPGSGGRSALRKRDLIAFFIKNASVILRHLADRPVALTRYPNGAFGPRFYQKDRPRGAPDHIQGVKVYSGTRAGDVNFLLLRSLADLVWMGQIAAIEIHPWISRITPPEWGDTSFSSKFSGSRRNLDGSALNYPDFLLFDIDPYVYSGNEKKGDEPELNRRGWELGLEGALLLKGTLDGLGMAAFVKTSGKTGIHIHAPIRRRLNFREVRAVVETIVNDLVASHPDRFTREWQKEKRRGKIFLDINQNVRGKNMAMVLCPRPVAGAPVSMPVTGRGYAFATQMTSPSKTPPISPTAGVTRGCRSTLRSTTSRSKWASRVASALRPAGPVCGAKANASRGILRTQGQHHERCGRRQRKLWSSSTAYHWRNMLRCSLYRPRSRIALRRKDLGPRRSTN